MVTEKVRKKVTLTTKCMGTENVAGWVLSVMTSQFRLNVTTLAFTVGRNDNFRILPI